MNVVGRISCLLIVVVVFATMASSQVKWLADASTAKIPDGNASGTVNGSTFSYSYGTLDKTGSISLGSDEFSFEHFTIHLRDAEKFWTAKFSIDVTVTVPKGALPDGKTFRKLAKDSLDESQPSLGGKGARVPEFLSLRMKGPAEFPTIGNIVSSSTEMLFSGIVTFGTRRDGRVPVGLYVCFRDERKSCVAGRVELEILEKENQ